MIWKLLLVQLKYFSKFIKNHLYEIQSTYNNKKKNLVCMFLIITQDEVM